MRVLTAHGKLVLQLPMYGVTPALFHPIRSQLFTQLAATRFVATCTTGLNVDDKTRNITFARFTPML